jgi:hypothetical protein
MADIQNFKSEKKGLLFRFGSFVFGKISPPYEDPSKMRLCTIGVSHYNEKVPILS